MENKVRFDERFLTEVADRNDIVDVVGQYVSLTKKSGQNLFGLCPFHNEKTASFSVSSSKQIYHCFGCGKGGGVVNFIMDIEGLSFPEAVEFLAKRAGMTIPEAAYSQQGKKRARLQELNRDAARFFYEQLSTPPGEKAKAYMASRKLSPSTAKTFGLGFAPDTWDSLKNAMNAKGYNDFELFDAGLVKKGKNGGFYDAFRDRLMFPVIDVKGVVIGFSGRMLGGAEPKYLNSPETLIFDKGKNLFGLNIAKRTKKSYMILVEGNIDVVMLHQSGFDCAVASLGTSLTPDQAKLLSKYTGEIVLAYDSDAAGQKAAKRAIEIFERLDVKTKVLRMNGAKDPDEYIKLKGSAAFENLIEGSESQIDFRLNNIKSKYNLDIPEQKVDFLKESVKLIATFPDGVARQVYAGRIAGIAGLKPDAISREVELQRNHLINSAKIADRNKTFRVETNAQPHIGKIHYDNVSSAKAEEGIIRIMMKDPSIHPDIKPEDFSSPELGKIYTILLESEYRNPAVLAGDLTTDEMNLLVSVCQYPEDLSNTQQTLSDYISRIKNDDSNLDLRALANKLKEEGKGYLQNEEKS